jgi:hypothetical protein
VILAIRERMHQRVLLHIAHFIDRIRVFAGSRAFRWVGAGFAAIIVTFAIHDWSKTGKLSDLAPELLAGFVMLLLTMGRKHS